MTRTGPTQPPAAGQAAEAATSSPDVRSRLEEAFDRERLPGIVSVYLFGSHAEGRAHRESDVDVGVLLDRASLPSVPDRSVERVTLGSWLIGALSCNEVDVVVLNDAPPLVGRKIVTDGIRVFCADSEKDLTFVRDVQLRAADLEPFLRKHSSTLLQAIMR
jgi:predicted nucleotidyltransferase